MQQADVLPVSFLRTSEIACYPDFLSSKRAERDPRTGSMVLNVHHILNSILILMLTLIFYKWRHFGKRLEDIKYDLKVRVTKVKKNVKKSGKRISIYF